MAVSVSATTTTVSDESTPTLTLGSGNNRAVILLVRQARTPPNVSTPTLNGGAGTEAKYLANGGGTQAVAIYYWLDAALPSSSGAYTLSYPGSAGSVTGVLIEATGVNQTSPLLQTYSVETTGATRGFTELSSSVTGALMVGTFYQNPSSASAITGTSGTTVTDSTVAGARFYKVDDGGHQMDIVSNTSATTHMYALAAFAAAASGSSAFIPPMRSAQYNAFASARQRFV